MTYVFQEQLDALLDDLADVSADVEVAVRSATVALLSGRADLAETVIDADQKIDRARARIEDRAIEILSLQAPVATDLRVVVAALSMISDLERMGDLSVHVAKIARLRTPDVAVPDVVRPTFARMAEVAEHMVTDATRIIRSRDVVAAEDLRAADDEMDDLRRDSFAQLLDGGWAGGIESAVDVALLGRYYERIADHAVAVADRVVFIVTGETPE